MIMVTKRNEKGQIIEGELSSEKAREMAKKRWEGEAAKQSGDREQLLEELGFDPKSPPKAAELLADQVVAGGARSVAALRELLKHSSKGKAYSGEWEGEGTCPACGTTQRDRINASLFTPAFCEAVAALLELYRRRRQDGVSYAEAGIDIEANIDLEALAGGM
jgi:hypothetical protein